MAPSTAAEGMGKSFLSFSVTEVSMLLTLAAVVVAVLTCSSVRPNAPFTVFIILPNIDVFSFSPLPINLSLAARKAATWPTTSVFLACSIRSSIVSNICFLLSLLPAYTAAPINGPPNAPASPATTDGVYPVNLSSSLMYISSGAFCQLPASTNGFLGAG